MKEILNKILAMLRDNKTIIKTVLLSIFFWQLFITLFWFSGSNLILLVILGIVNFGNSILKKK